MYRLLLALFLAPALAGCATVSHTLSPEQVAGFRLTAVTVGFAPDARIVWGDGERAYAASKGVAAIEARSVADTPQGQAYLRNAIASKVKGAMQEHLAERLTGSRPVRVEITVKEFAMAHAVQRVVLGGSHLMTADVNLVDAKTGETLVARPALVAPVAGGQGIVGALAEDVFMDEPADRVVKFYAQLYSIWLLRK